MNAPVSEQTSVTQSDKTPALSPAARNAWTVSFSTPAPQAMPADRLKARAELVRNALSTGTY